MATGINARPMFADMDVVPDWNGRVHTTTTAYAGDLDISNKRPLSLQLSVIDDGHQEARASHGKDEVHSR